MSIKKTSPHLSYFLERLYTEIPTLLEESFSLAMQKSGDLEPDYQRPLDQPYNPRPARHALIGIKDMHIKDLDSLQLLILSSLLEKGQFITPSSLTVISNEFPNIVTKRLLALEELHAEITLKGKSYENPEFPIFLCTYIDRMRHAHLAGKIVVKELYDRLNPDSIEPSKHTYDVSSLKLIIISWRNKIQRQYPDLLQ